MKKFVLFFLFVFILLAEEFPKTNIRYVQIQSGVLNVREKPVDGKIISKLKVGEKVTILGDAEGSYGWKKIKTSTKEIGFASDEFLGYFEPSEIQKGKLIGIVGSSESPSAGKKGALRVLGGQFAGKWYGFDGTSDFIYLLNHLVQNKKLLDVYHNTKKFGTFKAESIAKYGCQEFKGIQGTASSNQITSSNEKLFLATIGIPESKTQSVVTEKVSSEFSSKLLKEATSVFKKNKVEAKELENISGKKIVLINAANGKSYFVARFSINKEHAEKHSVSFVGEIVKNDDYKLIQNQFESLEEERGNYGGSFHFMGIIDLNENGTPAILFHHIGFDSGIYELFQIKENKIESIFLGGGDAC